MELFKGLNLLLRFLLELVSLYALGAWGFHRGSSSLLHWLLGLGIPLLFALAWGRWAAPNSQRRFKGFSRMVFEWASFGSAALALWLEGRADQAVLFTGMVILNIALLRLWKQW